MYGKKVKLRAIFILSIFFSSVLIVFLIFKSLEENVVYFKSPTEIKNLTELTSKKIRVGGMVKEKSINVNQSEVNFVITDFKNELIVNYSGSVPNLFEEGKGVVAEGFLKDRNFLTAVKILAKHDENYMPPEVEEALKESN
jgi:cytochrome c-type biogenesis protein CcmE